MKANRIARDSIQFANAGYSMAAVSPSAPPHNRGLTVRSDVITFATTNVVVNVRFSSMYGGTFVAYYRVSTKRQGASGLGLEAQQEAVRSYLNVGTWHLVAEVIEIESGKRSDRPKLAEALRLCRLHKATLIIAKLDRLARNVAFVSALMEAGVDFVAVDFPQANRLTVHILSAVAEHEAKAISERTTAALARAKARGVKLGGDRGHMSTIAAQGNAASLAYRQDSAKRRAADIAPIIVELQQAGLVSFNGIAAELNRRCIQATRGGRWSAIQVKRVLSHVT